MPWRPASQNDLTVVVVEWPDRVAELLPGDAMTVESEHLGEDARRITVR